MSIGWRCRKSIRSKSCAASWRSHHFRVVVAFAICLTLTGQATKADPYACNNRDCVNSSGQWLTFLRARTPSSNGNLLKTREVSSTSFCQLSSGSLYASTIGRARSCASGVIELGPINDFDIMPRTDPSLPRFGSHVSCWMASADLDRPHRRFYAWFR